MSENVLKFTFLGDNKFSKPAKEVEKSTDSLTAKIGHFGKIAGTALIGVGTAMGGMVAAGAVLGVKTAASLEQAQIGFATLLHSGKQAQVFLKGLTAFAAATPFELKGLIDSSRTLIGVGLNTKQTMKALQDFGDAASAVGIGQDSFQRVMLATSQAISAGKFMTADLNQIANNGIPIWVILSRSMHKTVPELRDLASKSKLLSSDVLPALEQQMHKDYGGAMAKQSMTLNGLWSTFTDTLSLGLAKAITPMIPALKVGLTNATKFASGALAKLPGVLHAMTGAFTTGRAYVMTRFAPGIRTAFGDIKGAFVATRDFVTKHLVPDLVTAFGKVKGSLPSIDISGIGAKFGTEAQVWGQTIIHGITIGLNSGDWKPLGVSLGTGLSLALASIGKGGLKLGAVVGEMFSSIDWFSIGETVGLGATPFIIGFNKTLFVGIFEGIKAHPLDAALLVAAFIPLGKFAAAFGPLRSLIEKLPFGKWITWVLDRSAVPAFDAIWTFVKSIGREMADAFAAEIPAAVRGGVGGIVRGVATEIAGGARYLVDAGRNLVVSLARGIGQNTARVLVAGARMIGRLLAPYADAGRWLIIRGREIAGGLIRGIGELMSPAVRMTTRLIGRITQPFQRAGQWLFGSGRSIVGGLIRGEQAMSTALGNTAERAISLVLRPFQASGRWLFQAGRWVLTGLRNGMMAGVQAAGDWARNIGGRIVSAVKSYFGIKSPSKVFTGIGKNLITSLFGAMISHNPVQAIGKIFGGMPQALGALVDKGLVSLKAMPGKALSALAGLGGKFAGAIFGGGGGGLSGPEKYIIMHESGGWTGAQNPHSTAFGLGQLILANRQHYGAILGVSPNTTDYGSQLAMFRMYVKDRYGTAQNAAAFWKQHHFYDSGGVATGIGMMAKNTLKPERVLSAGQTVSFDRLTRVLDRRPAAASNSVAAADIDYARLGDHVARAFTRAGISVQLDGRAVGKVMGGHADLLSRAG